jgi:hypothetical protein
MTYSVFVVNGLEGFEFASQHLLHHEAMLRLAAAEDAIAVFIDMPAATNSLVFRRVVGLN